MTASASAPRARRLFAHVVAASAPLAFVAAWLILRGDLPDRIATHFSGSGEADGYSPAHGFVLGFGAIVLVTAAVAIGLLRTGTRTMRYPVAILAGTGWFLAALGITLLVIARDAERASDARLPMWAVVPALLVGAVAGALAAWGAPHAGGSAAAPDPVTPPYELGRHERAVWVGRASSWPLRVLGLLLAVGAIVTGVHTMWAVTIGLAAGAVAVLMVTTLTVRVDDTGVSAHFGALRRPRLHVELTSVQQVDAVDQLRPLEWGGWGLRVTPRGIGMIVRGGPGLVIERSAGADVALSVDDPKTAADLVHALRARASA